MKRKLIIVLLLIVVITGKAQDNNHFTLFTDRDLYASGETLLLKLFAPNKENSGIVNVDLINSTGKVILGINKKIIDQQADGFMYLPDSLSSGCYFLCLSTKIGKEYTIKEIYVANRFTGIPESGGALRASGTNPIITIPAGDLQTEGLNKIYKTRDKVKVTLRLPSEFLSRLNGNLLASISKATPEYNPAPFTKSVGSRNLIVEHEGVVLEGKITDLKTGEPVNKGVVFLSIPDTVPRFNFFITGKDGRFNFQLDNYYGKTPVVVQGFDGDGKKLVKIAVNEGDSLKSILPDFETWIIPTELRKSSEQNTEAVTFSKIFNQQELAVQPVLRPKAEPLPFYGIPPTVVYPKLFIDLPDFTEISRELLTGVKFRTYNRIPTLQVFNTSQRSYFNEPPLLLLNGIPVRDLSTIKNLGSASISKVEISISERYYGNLRFPGVVVINTTKPDYSPVVEADDLIKLNLETMQPDATVITPGETPLNVPDLRKVLLWKPSLKPAKTIHLDFGTSDILGNYKMIIRGTTNDGSVFYKEQLFEVN